jgi:hypothetical protein
VKRLNYVFFIVFLLFIPLTDANAYMVKYKEDFYKLYHVHYQQYPDDCIENIYWLEKAVQADFCNPLFISSKLETEKEWEKYRYLFQMHLNLKLIEQHLRLGRTYDKKAIVFYDAPWKDEYLRNLEKTLSCYKAGLYYWQEAKVWYEKANTSSFNFLTLTGYQNWEDERERIFTGELNYEKILNREISRVEKNIEELKSMESKY